MRRFKLNHNYSSGFLPRGFAGDTVELTEEQAEFLERDSPGVLTALDPDPRAAATPADGGAVDPATGMNETQAAELAFLREQTPTIDIDVEDKALEVPGVGNKFTPASGYNPAPTEARIVERASDRMSRGGSKRGGGKDGNVGTLGQDDPARFDAATSGDTSANARINDLAPNAGTEPAEPSEEAKEAAREEEIAAAERRKQAELDKTQPADGASSAPQSSARIGTQTVTEADLKSTAKGPSIDADLKAVADGKETGKKNN